MAKATKKPKLEPLPFTTGDVITAYNSGWHVVTRVERRFYQRGEIKPAGAKVGEEYAPLVFYKTILDAKMKPKTGKKELCCDASYCEKWDKSRLNKWLEEQIEAMKTAYATLIKVIEP